MYKGRALIGVMMLLSVIPSSRLSAGDRVSGISFDHMVDLVEAAHVDHRQPVVDRYVEGRQEAGFPVVEDTLVHFIYKSGDVRTVSVPGDFNGWDKDRDMMTRIGGTDLFYLTKRFEPDARLDYKFVLDGERWVLDPLNPARVSGGFGPNSEVSLPSYVQPDEIRARDDIPHGKIEDFTFESAFRGNSRRVQVYLPPGYDDGAMSYPSLYVNDGGEYISLGNMDRVLDLLVSRGDTGGIIVIFVDPVDRNSEYWLDPDFERMIVEELVPLIDSRYRTIDSPDSRGMMGASLGGLISVHVTYRNPGLFGLCASQSGAFYPEDRRVIRAIADGAKKETRFYLDWGTYEPAIRSSNLGLLEVLRAGGYEVASFEYHEGHSWGSWRAHIDDILRNLYGPCR